MTAKSMLNGRERFALGALVTSAFAESKLSDPDFAKLASARLGFEVTPSNVLSVRKDLDIPANHLPANPLTKSSRLDSIDRRLGELEAHVATLLRERAERHHGGGK